MAAFSSIAAGVGAATALANTGMGIAGAAQGGPSQQQAVPGPQEPNPFSFQAPAPTFRQPIDDEEDEMINPFGGVPGGGGWI